MNSKSLDLNPQILFATCSLHRLFGVSMLVSGRVKLRICGAVCGNQLQIMQGFGGFRH